MWVRRFYSAVAIAVKPTGSEGFTVALAPATVKPVGQ